MDLEQVIELIKETIAYGEEKLKGYISDFSKKAITLLDGFTNELMPKFKDIAQSFKNIIGKIDEYTFN